MHLVIDARASLLHYAGHLNETISDTYMRKFHAIIRHAWHNCKMATCGVVLADFFACLLEIRVARDYTTFHDNVILRHLIAIKFQSSGIWHFRRWMNISHAIREKPVAYDGFRIFSSSCILQSRNSQLPMPEAICIFDRAGRWARFIHVYISMTMTWGLIESISLREAGRRPSVRSYFIVSDCRRYRHFPMLNISVWYFAFRYYSLTWNVLSSLPTHHRQLNVFIFT